MIQQVSAVGPISAPRPPISVAASRFSHRIHGLFLRLTPRRRICPGIAGHSVQSMACVPIFLPTGVVEAALKPVVPDVTTLGTRVSMRRSISTDPASSMKGTRRSSGVIVAARCNDSDSSSQSIQIPRTTSASSFDSQKRFRDIFTADTDSESDTDSDDSGDSADKARRRRRRQRRRQAAAPSDKRLPRHVVKILKRWLLSPEHYDYPYPDEENKAKLLEATGINTKQLNTWFTNARKRIWAPRRRKRGESIPEYMHVPANGCGEDEAPEGATRRSGRSRSGPPPSGSSSLRGQAQMLHPISNVDEDGVEDGGSEAPGDVLHSKETVKFRVRGSSGLSADGDVLDPFLALDTLASSPVVRPVVGTGAHVPIVASLAPCRPPRISAPSRLASCLGTIDSASIGIPPPPPAPISGSLEFISSPAGGISPFTMYRLNCGEPPVLTSPDPLIECTDDCLSEEDELPLDGELGPGTLGSLGEGIEAEAAVLLSVKSDYSATGLTAQIRSRTGTGDVTDILNDILSPNFTPSLLGLTIRKHG